MNIHAVLHKTILASLLLCVAFAAPGCSFLPPTQQSQEAVYTAGASTLIARLTQEAGATAVSRLTEIAQPGTRSSPPPKQILSPTAPPSEPPSPLPPTQTPVVTTPTPAPSSTPTMPSIPCNRVELLGDVTAPADTIFPAGAALTKVWRVQNTGSCTWGAGYALILTSGNLISPQATALPTSVIPGQVVDIGAAITVPNYSGVFQATWMLRSDSGQVFGVGIDGSVPLFARIHVLQPTAGPATSYDFTQNYCSLTWRSAEGALPCPGSSQDSDGSIVFVQTAALETGRASEAGLWTRPNRAAAGWISGQSPPLLIRNGDHFITEIGCLNGSPDCDVLFQFEYATLDGAAGRLGQWREVSDSQTTLVDLDLSSLAGRSASFTLSVFNRGRPRDANAIWLYPHIRIGEAPRANTLVWTREGSPNSNACDELHIRYTSSSSAQAVAYDCSGTLLELGRTSLSAAQVNQLIGWEQRLDDFEGEMYSASGGNPVITWLSFRGSGRVVAHEAEIQALSSFAAQIFNQITR